MLLCREVYEISCLPNEAGLYCSQQPQIGQNQEKATLFMLQDSLARNMIFWSTQSFLK